MGTILIVDDDKIIRKITFEILNDAGYRVLEAAGSFEGLEMLKKEKVDAVLLDVVMPMESGFEMIPQIKGIDEDVAIIIMTGFASTDSAIEAIRKGAYDYIKKPVASEKLLHSIKNALERRQLTLENRSLVQTLEDRINKLELFQQIDDTISSTLDLNKLMEKTMDITKSVLKAEACSILLLDETTGELVFSVALGEKGDEVKEFRIKKGQGIAGWVLEHGKPLFISDAQQDDRFFKGIDKSTGFQTRSMVAIPLFVKEKIVGVIEVINKVGGAYFDEEDKETLVVMAGHIAIAIDNARMTEDLKRSKDKIEEYNRNLESMVKKRTEELERANDELKSTQAQLLQTEKLSSLGQMAAGIAHEINNPIGFVNSNLMTMEEYAESLMELIRKYEDVVKSIRNKNYDLLKEGIKEVVKTRQEIKFDFIKDDIGNLIEESKEGTFRVYKIVRDLKDFSRVDEADKKFIDIHRAIDSTLNIAWNEIKYKAEVEKEYGTVPDIECLPSQLNQIFMNLLVNAAQAFNGTRGKIKIKTYSGKGKAFVEISDNAGGIPPENLNKIFDPFFTTKEPGKGTGLGLSMVYNIIKKHHGDIKVRSEVGEGTAFLVELPCEMEKHGSV